ncbi:foldase protein PrsA [Roseospira visakhapatnamensis]|uniref:Parvulin-like PPIase n=1 Tax=Roseospira visakhapatnamensis TaxID=390880 RepID=A0A7W6RHT2_9PROT|nr:peptidylprolyl isomerase [Roseospira visakhapatnamensis]MBB4268138.1 peptidyl-prolyl cis-trans isomerase C [Roseospira visakhapatnamensis]
MVRTTPRALAFSAVFALALSGGLGMFPGQASAQATADPESVVATVNGKDITLKAVQDMQARQPQLAQAPLPMVYETLVKHLVESQLIVDRAKAEGFADHPDVLTRLETMRDSVVRTVYLTKVVEDAATDEALEERYEAYKAAHPPEEEVRASHILVESEEDAVALIQKLEDGADFAELAKAESTGPSGPNGGDLGYFKRQGQMVEPFAEAAFALEAGAFTADPVQTQFGWHIIKVTDRRMGEHPSLDELRNQFVTEIAEARIESLLEELRGEADIVTKPVDEVLPSAK